jgi:hypothetical protein
VEEKYFDEAINQRFFSNFIQRTKYFRKTNFSAADLTGLIR